MGLLSPLPDRKAVLRRIQTLADYIVNVCAEVGLHDGSTVGSLVARVLALEVAEGGAFAPVHFDFAGALTPVGAADTYTGNAQGTGLALVPVRYSRPYPW